MRTDVVALDAELKRRDSLKEQLLQMCPELAEDDEALIDTLDGETDVKEMLVALARSYKEREAAEKAVKSLVKTYQERAKRHADAMEAIKGTIAWGLQRLGQTKIKHAHCTLSLRDLDDKIEVIADKETIDSEMLPAQYIGHKVTTFVDVEKIVSEGFLQEAIEDGVVKLITDRKSVTIRL